MKTAGKLAVAPAAFVAGCWMLVTLGRAVERAEEHRYRLAAWGNPRT